MAGLLAGRAELLTWILARSMGRCYRQPARPVRRNACSSSAPGRILHLARRHVRFCYILGCTYNRWQTESCWAHQNEQEGQARRHGCTGRGEAQRLHVGPARVGSSATDAVDGRADGEAHCRGTKEAVARGLPGRRGRVVAALRRNSCNNRCALHNNNTGFYRR